MTKDDLKRVAPLWMEYTQRVRLDPLVRESPIPSDTYLGTCRMHAWLLRYV